MSPTANGTATSQTTSPTRRCVAMIGMVRAVATTRLVPAGAVATGGVDQVPSFQGICW